MTTKPEPIRDYTFCAGQDKDGGMVCAYRSGCKRFTLKLDNLRHAEFWKAEDDCANYQSKQS
jgi:hypothetical protein